MSHLRDRRSQIDYPLWPKAQKGTSESQVEPEVQSLATFLFHLDPRLQKALEEAEDDFNTPLSEGETTAPDSDGESLSELDLEGTSRLPLPMLTTPRDFYGPPIDVPSLEEQFQETFRELLVSPPVTKFLSDLPGPFGHNHTVSLKVNTDKLRREMVEHDDDILTSEEVKSHWPEVREAKLTELLTWSKYRCVSRKSRRDARNIIHVRWVLKLNWEYLVIDAAEGQKEDFTQKPRRIIRARLTVRGFRDQDKWEIERYAGTSSRMAQRLLVSEAVRQGWKIYNLDMSKAFLQRVTYEELAKLTSEGPREANFNLPAASVELLRKVPGFKNFDRTKEVLHCDKPATDLTDSRRAFSIKFGQTTSRCGLRPSKIDPEFCMRNDQGRLTCVITKHMDDIKIAGALEVADEILKVLDQDFGKFKIAHTDFVSWREAPTGP